MSELNEMSGKTLDIEKQNIEKLKELFPEIMTEDKIDFEKLRLILGDEVNDNAEKYSFTWNGKQNAIKLAQQPSTGTLRPNKEKSKDWATTENLYIEGDNLEVLKSLQKSYAEKVKVIYIDPPYNTGGDFIYKDNFKNSIQNYFEQTNQVDSQGNKLATNTESSGRFHTDWLNMMYPRLILAKNLLKDDGIIFISIDERELSNLKKICDEIFGERNFIEVFSWQKTSTPPNLSKKTKKSLEYILAYQKNDVGNLAGIKKISQSTNGLMNQSNNYGTLIFPKEVIKTSMNNESLSKGVYGTQSYKIELLNDVNIVNGEFDEDVVLHGKFKWSQVYLEEQIANGTDIYIKTKTLSPSYEKEEYEAEKPWNLIDSKVNVGTNVNASDEVDELFRKNFSDNMFPKPVSLLKFLISMIDTENEIILDFFSGSSTTAHAVLELNKQDNLKRKFIMVQIPEPLDEKSEPYSDGYRLMTQIGIDRINRVGNKILDDSELLSSELDVGFKVFELDNSNIQKWSVDAESLEESLFAMENNFVEGRSHTDIVYEVLLKLGLDLNTPFEESTIEDSTIYDVALGNVYVVLGNNITQKVANYIAKKQKEYENENPSVVFNDNGFKNDNEKLNAIEILKNNGFNEEQLMSI